MKVHINDKSIEIALKEIEKFISFDENIVIESRAVREYGWKFIKTGKGCRTLRRRYGQNRL